MLATAAIVSVACNKCWLWPTTSFGCGLHQLLDASTSVGCGLQYLLAGHAATIGCGLQVLAVARLIGVRANIHLGGQPSFARMAKTTCLSRGPAREKK